VFIFSIPIQQAENLQRIRSNRASRLSPTISFVANNSPAKAGLVKGGSLGISIKGRRKPEKRGGEERRNIATHSTRQQQKKPRKTEQLTQRKIEQRKHNKKKKRKYREEQKHQPRFRPCKKQVFSSKKYIHIKGEKGRESWINPVFVPARKQLIIEPSVIDRKQSNPHQRCSFLHHRQKRKAIEPHQHCSLLCNLQKQVRPFPFVFAPVFKLHLNSAKVI